MSDDVNELRRLVADAHGLDPEAAKFLTGSTLTEVEESAATLARLIAERHEQETAAAPPGPFTNMAAERARRKAALTAIFTGRPVQPRDEQGRYARAGEFHRGAREPAPTKPRSHNETLLEVLARRSADAGGRF
jgi:hypothetical protein